MFKFNQQIWNYGVAIALVIVATGLMLVLNPYIQLTQASFLLFFGAVTISAWYGGRNPGLLATFLSVLCAKYFFLEPVLSLSLTFASASRIALFSFQGCFISALVGSLRIAQQQSKRNLEQLQESQARFHRLVDSNIIGVVSSDINGAIHEVNDEFLRMTGFTQEDVRTGRVRWNQMTPTDLQERDRQALNELLKTGKSTPYEKAFIGKDGQKIPVIVGSALLHKTPESLISFVLDLSKRKQAELEIQKFVSLADNSMEFIGMCDMDFVPFYANEAAKQLVGLDDTWQFKETPVWEFFFPEDQDFIINEFFPRVLREGRAEVEIRFRHFKTGEALWMIYNVFYIRGEDNQPIGLATVSRNITARKQAELERELLLARERHYMNQLQGLTTAALAINSALSVEQVLQVITDQAASIIRTHQSSSTMTIDQNWAKAITAVYLSDKYAAWRNDDEKPDGSGIYAEVCQLNRPMRMTQAELEANQSWQDFTKQSKNHPPLRGWLAAPLVKHDGRNIGLIQLSDKYEGEFTEADEAILVQLAQMASVAIKNAQLYQAEQQARSTAEQLREEAQSANRIKDEFLAVLSHELRSPLNPILGWTQLLQTGKLDATKTANALSVIERNVKLQSQLIEDLLDVSRILQGKVSLNIVAVDLATIIQSAMETVRLAAQAKSIQLQHHLDLDVGLVSGDPARLQQIVWNLLSNAVKFTPQGGRVDIWLERHGNIAQITVTDTGQGIKPDFLPYVFDYFRQADSTTTRKFGGLGLGLAIVRHLAELHGGTVQAESLGEGQGAKFTVRLPLLANPSQVQRSHQSSASSVDLSGVKVLLVDDDPDTLEFVTFLLEQAGAKVVTATFASEALAILIISQPDLLISDIGMPGMDGYALMRQIRALRPEKGGQIPAIALTAYAGDFNQQQALEAGFQKHISKPLESEILLRVITNLIRHN
jgi:PAS domain S-box-containing protein